MATSYNLQIMQPLAEQIKSFQLSVGLILACLCVCVCVCVYVCLGAQYKLPVWCKSMAAIIIHEVYVAAALLSAVVSCFLMSASGQLLGLRSLRSAAGRIACHSTNHTAPLIFYSVQICMSSVTLHTDYHLLINQLTRTTTSAPLRFYRYVFLSMKSILP